MGMFAAFAQGMLQGYSDVAKERRAKEIADAEAKAAAAESLRDYNLELDKYNLDVQEHELAKSKADGEFILGLVKENALDFSDPAAQSFFKQRGLEGLIPLVNKMDDAENTTVFGQGKNAVTFPWNYDEKTSTDFAEMNLRDYQKILSSPDMRADYMSKFAENPDAAKAWLGTLDGLLVQFEQDFHFKNSGQDSVTGAMTSPVYTDFAQYKNVISFADELRTGMGLEGVAAEHRVVEAVINTQTKGQGLKPNQIFVKTADTSAGFTGGIMEVSEEERLFLDGLASDKGYVDTNHMLFSMDEFMYEEGGGTSNVTLLLDRTRQLYDAGALKMLNSLGADNDTENNVAELIFGTDGISPKGDLPEIMSAILPLIPEPREFRVAGTEVPLVNGKTFMENRGIDVDELSNKNEFAKKAVELNDIIVNNLEDGKVKLGFAGLMQKVGIGIGGPGGQLNQLFGDVPVDSLEEGTTYQSLQAATEEVLGKYSISVEGALGETQVAAIQLAYAQARAVDGNGRLSDADFKIQLDTILGSGLFQNVNVQISSLKTLHRQFSRVVEDSEFYVSMASEDIGPKQAKMFEANRIIERARKRDRTKKAANIAGDTSLTVASTFADMQKQGMTFTDAPYKEEGFKYYRNQNNQLVRVSDRDDTARVITDINSISSFYVMPNASNQAPVQNEQPVDNATAEQPVEQPTAEVTTGNLIPARQFAGNPPPFQDGFYIINGKKHTRIESTGPSGKPEPFYKEVR